MEKNWFPQETWFIILMFFLGLINFKYLHAENKEKIERENIVSKESKYIYELIKYKNMTDYIKNLNLEDKTFKERILKDVRRECEYLFRRYCEEVGKEKMEKENQDLLMILND